MEVIYIIRPNIGAKSKLLTFEVFGAVLGPFKELSLPLTVGYLPTNKKRKNLCICTVLLGISLLRVIHDEYFTTYSLTCGRIYDLLNNRLIVTVSV